MWLLLFILSLVALGSSLSRDMSDSEDSDDDDLFADFEATDDVDNINVSANLVEDVGEDKVAAKSGEDDGKRIEWVAPSVSGLKNSNTVNSAEKHWYKDDQFKNKPDANKRKPQSVFTPSTPNGGRTAPNGVRGPNGVCFW